MSDVQRTAIMPYSAAQMYKLVADINSYKDFLPWCSDSKTLKISEDKSTVEAKVWVKKGPRYRVWEARFPGFSRGGPHFFLRHAPRAGIFAPDLVLAPDFPGFSPQT